MTSAFFLCVYQGSGGKKVYLTYLGVALFDIWEVVFFTYQGIDGPIFLRTSGIGGPNFLTYEGGRTVISRTTPSRPLAISLVRLDR
jgi:hypothetical protein